MKRKLLLFVFCFCSLNAFVACSKDDNEPDWEGCLETHEVILEAYANDTIIRFKSETMSGITGVTELIGEKIIKHEFDYELGILKGEWFGIVLQNGEINLRTLKNFSGKERKLKIFLIFDGQGDYLNVLQKNAY